MDNCKEIQSRIESFEHGNLSLKDEEAFTNHILKCADCREEMEIYYIISYGLDDDNEKEIKNCRVESVSDRKSTRLNSSHRHTSRMPSSA